MKRSLGIRLVLLTLLLFCAGTVVRAEQEPILYNSYTEGEQLHLYVGGVETADSVTCQIGQVQCQDTSIETEVEIETILLVDNSLSIDGKYHDVIDQTLKKVIGSISEQETITIATFDTQIHYLIEKSADSEALLQTVDSISYENLDTKVTDVMYALCKELGSDPFDGLRRIILISDGAEYSSIGYTRQEVRTELQELSYPVYTIGCTYRDNTDDLEEMFSLSRLTGAKSVWLDEINDPDVITETVNGCKTVLKVTVTIPEELRDGASKGLRLIFRIGEGEVSLSTTEEMPFLDGTGANGNGSSQQAAGETETETEETESPETGESERETGTESVEETEETAEEIPEMRESEQNAAIGTEKSDADEAGETIGTQEDRLDTEVETGESETETGALTAWGNWSGSAGTESSAAETKDTEEYTTDSVTERMESESRASNTGSDESESEIMIQITDSSGGQSEVLTRDTDNSGSESKTAVQNAEDTGAEANGQQDGGQNEDPLKMPLLIVLLLLLVLLLFRRLRKSGNERGNDSGRKKTEEKTEQDTDFNDNETCFGDDETSYDEETCYGEEYVFRDDSDMTQEQEAEYQNGGNETERTLILDGNEAEEMGTQEAEFVTIRLTDMRNPTRITEVPLSAVVSVGRNTRTNQAIFEYEKSVSSRHCEIFLRNGRIFVRDLDSTNGTWVDDVRVEDELELYSGAVLKMGRLEAIFEILDPTEDPYGTE